MRLIEKTGQIEIWEVTEAYGLDFYVYGVRSDPVVCPPVLFSQQITASQPPPEPALPIPTREGEPI